MALTTAEWLAAEREVQWRIDVTDAAGVPQEEPLFAPDVVDNRLSSLGSLRFALSDQSIISGSITTVADPRMLIGRYLRPVITVNGQSEPLGLLQGTADPAAFGLAGWRDIEVIDASIAMARNLRVQALAAKAGTNVASWLRARAADAAPSLRTAVADSGETFRTDMWWDVGTPELVLQNEAAVAALYEPWRMSREGVLVADRWQPPAEKAVAFRFDADAQDTIVVGDFQVDTDYLAIPNRVLVHARGSGNAPALTGLWEDRSPNSPWSYDARDHQWVTLVIRDADVTSQAVATQMARSELIKAQTEAVTLTFQHPWVPITAGDVVEFRSERHGINGRFEVQETRPTMSLSAMTTTTARKVVDL